MIYNAKNVHHSIGMHSFIVIDDTAGEIKGLDYDIIALIMSSMTTEEKKEKYHKYKANLSILPDDRTITNDNGLSAFVKADQFFYFRKESLKYKTLGRLNDDILTLLFDFIKEINDEGVKIVAITDNL